MIPANIVESFFVIESFIVAEKVQYTLFVDESGDPGIKKVRSAQTSGASPYMVLAGALVPNNHKKLVTEELQKVSKKFNRDALHCADLNHNQIPRYAVDIAATRFLAFGVVSFKQTLGSYSNDIGKNHAQYYHKCMQYLLEIVGEAAKTLEIGADQIDVYIESGVVELNPLKKFIKNCQENPMHPRARFLLNIDTNRIVQKEKFEEPILQLPDLIAHSIYRCVDQTDGNYGILEYRYLRELRQKFHHNQSSSIVLGWGIKPIHKLRDLNLTSDTACFLEALKAD